MATVATPTKSRALLFGLNYAHAPDATLNGCINDVKNMAAFLGTQIPDIKCEVITDDVDRLNTSAQGLIRKLYELATRSFSEDLDFVWIHYSGHGSYIRDRSGDERDGQDECLVPSDFKTAGLISDDILQSLLRNFNPKTRVVCVFDCCHSGTIADVKYSWDSKNIMTTENSKCVVKSKVITLSGCTDQQTSADAYNVMNDAKFTGALTSCMLMSLQKTPELRYDVFKLADTVRALLKERNFSQYPKLCSSYDLSLDPRMF